jgi:hypothetical protein
VDGSLAIELGVPASKLSLTVAHPALRGGSGLVPSARLPHAGTAPQLSVTLLDTGGATSRLSIAARRDR